jgi:hypothetical protein
MTVTSLSDALGLGMAKQASPRNSQSAGRSQKESQIAPLGACIRM